MLTGRMLPPIRCSPPSPPPPVATFFNVPRRYVKSSSQVGDDTTAQAMGDQEAPRTAPRAARMRAPAKPNFYEETEEQTRQEEKTSPQTRSKRLATLFEDGGPDEESASPADTPRSATSTGSSPEYAGYVCLCQPEPRIPRPRNAFILYRQHHQYAILERNPGLSNPEISKVIGEQWKSEPEDRKRIWQDLAQEEKARHHEQYPDYRYQPRRLGKPGSSLLNTPSHTTVDKYRCPKCGGRSIRTTSSPFYPDSNSSTPTLPPPKPSEGLSSTTNYLPIMSNLTLEQPVHARRGGHGLTLASHHPAQVIRDDAVYGHSAHTPTKKRRFEVGPPPTSAARRPEGQYYVPVNRRDSIPAVQTRYSPPNSAGMPPVRTPVSVRDQRRPSALDLGPPHPPSEGSPRTVEEVLGVVPYQNKIKLLGRIVPPYKCPDEVSQQNRGAIVAVEGDDMQSVRELCRFLEEHFAKESDYVPRVAHGPKLPEEGAESTFEEYLDVIHGWHGKSKEMIAMITQPFRPSEDRVMSDSEKTEASNKDTRKTPRSSPSPPASTSTAAAASSSQKTVILLPTFQLHASITYASRIPIADAYSAADHWQWMATMWRGTVGPDLTVYVKTYEAKEGVAPSKPDMDEATRCLTVFKAKDGKFVDADLRRVGFEVGEWIRSIGSGRNA